MTADEKDFLDRVKAAQDVGLTSAEVWRMTPDERFCPECNGKLNLGNGVSGCSCGDTRCSTCGSRYPSITLVEGVQLKNCPNCADATLCRRCKRPTDYGARWCYDCERAMWGDE